MQFIFLFFNLVFENKLKTKFTVWNPAPFDWDFFIRGIEIKRKNAPNQMIRSGPIVNPKSLFRLLNTFTNIEYNIIVVSYNGLVKCNRSVREKCHPQTCVSAMWPLSYYYFLVGHSKKFFFAPGSVTRAVRSCRERVTRGQDAFRSSWEKGFNLIFHHEKNENDLPEQRR